ncbi:MAG: hypothetical protein QOF04_3115 [Solirubrobacteraceae bacterium]|nr:hypothetical protein [Solirubrobacteraceae bacterium]
MGATASRRLLLALACAAIVLVAIALVTGGGDRDVTAGGSQRWVDAGHPACSDAQERGGRDAPFCSVQRAAAVAVPGDTVHIAPGRYRGTVRLARGGTPDAPIRLVADAPGVVLDAAGAANAVKLVGTGDVHLVGVRVTGGVNQGVWVEGADRVRLERVTVSGNTGTGVQIKSGAGTQVVGSELSDNGRAGLLELAAARGTRVTDTRVTGNGHDGAPYNGDGIQLGGVGAQVTGSVISGNGDSTYEHGIYTGAGSAGWRLSDNVLTGNAGANIKAAGVGEITGNRLTDGRYGLVLSDNPGRVLVRQNLIGGRAQHLVFLTSGATAARGSLLQNTIVQSGRSTGSGEASALFVLAADDLELRNNLVAYTGADAAGVSLWINDPARVGRLVSDTNWWAANDGRSRHLGYGGRVSLADWRSLTGQDARSVTSWSPRVDHDLRVTSTNWGAGRGENLGLLADVMGLPRATSGPVDVGAHGGLRVGA